MQVERRDFWTPKGDWSASGEPAAGRRALSGRLAAGTRRIGMEAPGASGVRPGVCPRETRAAGSHAWGRRVRRRAGGVTCHRPLPSGERGNGPASRSRRSQLPWSIPRSPPPPTPPTSPAPAGAGGQHVKSETGWVRRSLRWRQRAWGAGACDPPAPTQETRFLGPGWTTLQRRSSGGRADPNYVSKAGADWVRTQGSECRGLQPWKETPCSPSGPSSRSKPRAESSLFWLPPQESCHRWPISEFVDELSRSAVRGDSGVPTHSGTGTVSRAASCSPNSFCCSFHAPSPSRLCIPQSLFFSWPLKRRLYF